MDSTSASKLLRPRLGGKIDFLCGKERKKIERERGRAKDRDRGIEGEREREREAGERTLTRVWLGVCLLLLRSRGSNKLFRCHLEKQFNISSVHRLGPGGLALKSGAQMVIRETHTHTRTQ